VGLGDGVAVTLLRSQIRRLADTPNDEKLFRQIAADAGCAMARGSRDRIQLLRTELAEVLGRLPLFPQGAKPRFWVEALLFALASAAEVHTCYEPRRAVAVLLEHGLAIEDHGVNTYRLGPMAGDECGLYYVGFDGRESLLFRTPDEAAKEFLK
jgi:hypothetical protein